MSIKTNVSVFFVPASASEGFTFNKAPVLDEPAHWAVFIDYIEDNNAMTASMHQYAFVCKPTAKQLRQCKRDAMTNHIAELAQFKLDYEHCFA